jgi:hypothetical protein
VASDNDVNGWVGSIKAMLVAGHQQKLLATSTVEIE